MKFDEMSGLSVGPALGRRPLLSLGEGDDKSTPDAVSAHGLHAAERKSGNPNDSYSDKAEKAEYGKDWMNGRVSAAALRSQKPYQSDTE